MARNVDMYRAPNTSELHDSIDYSPVQAIVGALALGTIVFTEDGWREARGWCTFGKVRMLCVYTGDDLPATRRELRQSR